MVDLRTVVEGLNVVSKAREIFSARSGAKEIKAEPKALAEAVPIPAVELGLTPEQLAIIGMSAVAIVAIIAIAVVASGRGAVSV